MSDMIPDAWCKCCNASGSVPEVKVCYDFHLGLSVIKIDNDLVCPGCNGTGVSARAHQWRKENNYVPT